MKLLIDLLKALLFFILILAIGFAGFVTVLGTSWGGGSPVLVWMAIITVFVLWTFVIILFLGFFPKKKVWQGMGIYTGICLLIFTAVEINRYRIDRIPVLNTELELTDYEPFRENSKAIALNESSTLKLTDTLPLMDGATALYPVYSAFAKAVYPSKKYYYQTSEVMCSNTPRAYQKIVDGETDIIFVARPSQEQLDYAKSKNVKLILTPIGKEAFVFFVNADNKVDELKLEQIKKIYTGAIRNWSEVGGRNTKILAYQRPEGSGSQTMLNHIFKDSKLAIPEINERKMGMGGIIKETADYKNYGSAIGFSFLYYSTQMVKNKDIKLLKIDGIAPGKATILNGKYPLSGDFYAVTTNKSKPNTLRLLQWIIGKQGQYLIDKTGYVSIR